MIVAVVTSIWVPSAVECSSVYDRSRRTRNQPKRRASRGRRSQRAYSEGNNSNIWRNRLGNLVALDRSSRAAEEVHDLHVSLQAWFRGEGDRVVASISAHFDPRFKMITPGAHIVKFEAFEKSLPDLYGSRPGLIMEIDDLEVHYCDSSVALVRYRETQHKDGTSNVRHSSALLTWRGSNLLWLFLQETWKE